MTIQELLALRAAAREEEENKLGKLIHEVAAFVCTLNRQSKDPYTISFELPESYEGRVSVDTYAFWDDWDEKHPSLSFHFPIAWLDDPDWKQKVTGMVREDKLRIEKIIQDEKDRAARLKEEIELAELARLQAKYGCP